MEFFSNNIFLFLILIISGLIYSRMTFGGMSSDVELINSNGAVNLINSSPTVILDFRSSSEFDRARIASSINIKKEDINSSNQTLKKIKKNKKILLIANSHFELYSIIKNFKDLNYQNIHVLQGGINSWINSDLPVDNGSI